MDPWGKNFKNGPIAQRQKSRRRCITAQRKRACRRAVIRRRRAIFLGDFG
jgi:hypothetical protein